MRLRKGYSDIIIRNNVAQGLNGGRSRPHAVSDAYDEARMSALSAGDVDRFKELVGADLPDEIQSLNEAQTFAAMQAMDKVAATRRLSPLEVKRLTNLELRMEQFSGVAPEISQAEKDSFLLTEAQHKAKYPELYAEVDPNLIVTEVPVNVDQRGGRYGWLIAAVAAVALIKFNS